MTQAKSATSLKNEKTAREKYGHSIPSDQLPQVAKQQKGALNIINELIKTEKLEDDQSMIDIKITNPLHKITQILQDIKTHQSTTFSMRFTIPLIALPIVIFAAYQIGKGEVPCSEFYTSRIGLVKNMEVFLPAKESSFLDELLSQLPIQLKSNNKIDLVKDSRSILITSNEVITILEGSDVNLNSYNEKSVIMTGKYSTCNNSLTLDSSQNIISY